LKQQFKKNKWIFLILLVSILLRLFYLAHTPFNIRTHDVIEKGGHLDYIKYFSKNNSPPPPGAGWEYHQPPLYYLITSWIYKVINLLGITNPNMFLQLTSLIYFVVFLVFAYKIILILTKNKNIVFYLSIIMLSFWPSGIMHSIRIGNDLLFYAFYAIALYFIQNYYLNDNSKDLTLGILFSSLALLTKANGLSLYIILFFVSIYKISTKKFKKKHIILNIALLLGGIIGSFFTKVYYFFNGESKDLLLGNTNITINPILKVNNNLLNYITFDFKTYLINPFTSTWIDNYGRQFFWNFVLKSSIFGEFMFFDSILFILGLSLSLLSLFFYLSIIISVIFLKKEEVKKYLVMLLNLFIPFILLLLYRIHEPYASNTDFRYAFPSLISLIFFSNLLVENIKKENHNNIKKEIGILVLVVNSIFVILSSLFILFIN